MPTPTGFFRWWIIDERTGKRRLTSRAATSGTKTLRGGPTIPLTTWLGRKSMSDLDELRRCHEAWQKAREDYFERLDRTIAGQPMDWEHMTASVIAMDKCLREFMGAAERTASG